MSDVGVKVRCQRCGDQMELRDPAPGHALAAQSVLGVSTLRPTLLDHLPLSARRGGGASSSRCETPGGIAARRHPMKTRPDLDDEDDEILEDEEFDENAELEEGDEDFDPEADEDEETWQVVAS